MEASLMLFVTATILVSFISGIESTTTFTMTNDCPYTIWPGAQDNANVPSLGNTGFVLNSGASSSIIASDGWGGRFWPRTRCTTFGGFTCATGDCGSGQVSCNGNGGTPPVILAEFILNDNGGNDFFDVINNVNGFNVPITITPGGGYNITFCP